MAHGGALAGVTLHRFFLPSSAFLESDILFPRDTSHQIGKVLRLRAHDRVVVLDGTGWEFVVRLTTIGPEVRGAIEERRRNDAEPETRLTLYQSVVKGPKLDLILQKCTEIGVARFVPVLSDRSVVVEVNPHRKTRFASIVREAAEQSRRGVVPIVDEPLLFPDAVSRASSRGPLVFLWEDERAHTMRDLDLGHPGTVNLFVGPEGGFSPHEVEMARQAGARVITLGPRILRAETAAIVGSALLLAGVRELG